MYSVNGQLQGIHTPTTPDIDSARRSLRKYLNFDIASVVCYHGGLSSIEVNNQIVQLTQEP